MTTFLLVHGGWHGGWCWERVVARLGAAGQRVTTPTLAGLGERAGEATPQIDVSHHAGEIARFIEQAGDPGLVVVAHSYAGFPAELAIRRVPDRVGHLVHLDAFVPRGGDAILDYFPPPIAEAVRAQARAAGGWRVPPLPPEMMGLQAPEDIAWVMPRLTPQPLATMEERVPADDRGASVPRTYLECSLGAEQKPFGLFAARAREQGWGYRSIAAGHDAMVTAPDLVAAALLDVAKVATKPATKTV